MVYLILTRPGFDSARPLVKPEQDIVWVGANVLADDEVAVIRSAGWAVTTFSRVLTVTDLTEAVDTVREHHPGQSVWTEWPSV